MTQVIYQVTAAVQDRDQIYAVIRGSAINNDGMDRIGFTAPSVEGQANAIADANLRGSGGIFAPVLWANLNFWRSLSMADNGSSALSQYTGRNS